MTIEGRILISYKSTDEITLFVSSMCAIAQLLSMTQNGIVDVTTCSHTSPSNDLSDSLPPPPAPNPPPLTPTEFFILISYLLILSD